MSDQTTIDMAEQTSGDALDLRDARHALGLLLGSDDSSSLSADDPWPDTRSVADTRAFDPQQRADLRAAQSRLAAADAGVALHQVNIASDMDAVRALGIRGVPSLVKVADGVPTLLSTGGMGPAQTRDVLTGAGLLGA